MQTYIISFGKSRTVLKESATDDEAVLFICQINKGSEYLKMHTFESFEADESLGDGLYVIKQDSIVRVYRSEMLTLDGYMYSSMYKTRRISVSYELVHGESDKL